jgi:hypothetical protein
MANIAIPMYNDFLRSLIAFPPYFVVLEPSFWEYKWLPIVRQRRVWLTYKRTFDPIRPHESIGGLRLITMK